MGEMEKHQEKLKQKLDSPSAGADERYCPDCGKEVLDHSLKRFGEYFCSEAHVAEYAREVRARVGKEQVAVAEKGAVQPDGTETTAAEKGGLSRLLKLGACCAAPILALIILVPLLRGGTTGLGAVAGNVLYFAALLACPLGMYFMMRSMHRTQEDETGEGRGSSVKDQQEGTDA